MGTFRGMRKGAQQYGGVAFGTRGNQPVGTYDGYEPLVVDIVRFFEGAPAPVTAAETVEIFAFMEGADDSKRAGGVPVSLSALIEKARREAATKRSW